MDLLTRAVIIEFSLYSAGTDMTAMVAMLAEFPLTGGVITSYEIQSQKLMWFQSRHVDPLMVLQVSYTLCTPSSARDIVNHVARMESPLSILAVPVDYCGNRARAMLACRETKQIWTNIHSHSYQPCFV